MHTRTEIAQDHAPGCLRHVLPDELPVRPRPPSAPDSHPRIEIAAIKDRGQHLCERLGIERGEKPFCHPHMSSTSAFIAHPRRSQLPRRSRRAVHPAPAQTDTVLAEGRGDRRSRAPPPPWRSSSRMARAWSRVQSQCSELRASTRRSARPRAARAARTAARRSRAIAPAVVASTFMAARSSAAMRRGSRCGCQRMKASKEVASCGVTVPRLDGPRGSSGWRGSTGLWSAARAARAASRSISMLLPPHRAAVSAYVLPGWPPRLPARLDRMPGRPTVLGGRCRCRRAGGLGQFQGAPRAPPAQCLETRLDGGPSRRCGRHGLRRRHRLPQSRPGRRPRMLLRRQGPGANGRTLPRLPP